MAEQRLLRHSWTTVWMEGRIAITQVLMERMSDTNTLTQNDGHSAGIFRGCGEQQASMQAQSVFLRSSSHYTSITPPPGSHNYRRCSAVVVLCICSQNVLFCHHTTCAGKVKSMNVTMSWVIQHSRQTRISLRLGGGIFWRGPVSDHLATT